MISVRSSLSLRFHPKRLSRLLGRSQHRVPSRAEGTRLQTAHELPTPASGRGWPPRGWGVARDPEAEPREKARTSKTRRRGGQSG